jgi:PKD repeat protein
VVDVVDVDVVGAMVVDVVEVDVVDVDVVEVDVVVVGCRLHPPVHLGDSHGHERAPQHLQASNVRRRGRPTRRPRDRAWRRPFLRGARRHRPPHFNQNQPPIAVATANPTNGAAPLTVAFDGTASSDPDGDALTYAWDLDG